MLQLLLAPPLVITKAASSYVSKGQEKRGSFGMLCKYIMEIPYNLTGPSLHLRVEKQVDHKNEGEGIKSNPLLLICEEEIAASDIETQMSLAPEFQLFSQS